MNEKTFNIDKEVYDEAVEIAAMQGYGIDEVVNTLLTKFNAEKGFFFPLDPEEIRKRSIFSMNSDEFEQACKYAVTHRKDVPGHNYVTLLDEATGKLIKKFKDGHTEDVN